MEKDDFIEGIKAGIIGPFPFPTKKIKTISDHYGIKEENYTKWVKDILCDLIQSDNKADALDKHFKNLDAESRVKIICFSEALDKFEKLNIPR